MTRKRRVEKGSETPNTDEVIRTEEGGHYLAREEGEALADLEHLKDAPIEAMQEASEPEWDFNLFTLRFHAHLKNKRRFCFVFESAAGIESFDIDYRRVFPTLEQLIGRVRKVVHERA